MAEEIRMDKKSLNRSSLQQSRPHAIDCKKGTEVSYKPWLRNNKKREGGPSNLSKNEPYRKNAVPIRGRGSLDKRSRSRDTNDSVGGTQNTRVEEDEPEIGSVFVPGSKKQNLSHLLNFSYPSRCGNGADKRCPVPRRQAQARVIFRQKSDNYLRSHSQFVVKELGDYKSNLLDPDIPIKWEQIEEIVIRSTGRSECPICLGTPVAGRVSVCGHVYCWACILHYAATHEKQPPPCPVCTTPIQVPDMKPTRIIQWDSPADEVTMRLVRRLRGSTFVEIAPPRGHATDTIEPNILPLEVLSQAPFSKLFSATKQQIIDKLEKDRSEIKNQIMAEIDTSEITFLEQALQMLDLKEEKVRTQYFPSTSEKSISKNDNIEPEKVYENCDRNEKKIDWFDEDVAASCLGNAAEETLAINVNVETDLNLSTEETYPEDDSTVVEFPLTEYTPECIPEEDNFTDIDKLNQAKYFYFYQAEDGQQVFLNSINVRMLNLSWGSLAAAPPVITGRVLHREVSAVQEQTRKHMPCTAHLPLQCAYEIVELDLKPPYITPEAFNKFSDELNRRARFRAKLERDEKRRERAYRRAMEGPPKPDISSAVLFPPASYGSPPYVEPPIVSPVDEHQQFPSTSVSEQEHPVNVSPAGLSFAKMASASGTWRVRKVQSVEQPSQNTEEESMGPRNLVLSDAIEAALQAAKPSKPSGKKTKKMKQKVLFATGVQRSA